MSARLPFVVTHNFHSVLCCLVVSPAGTVLQLEAVGPKEDGEGPLGLFAAARERIEFLNDLMAADMPFEALKTCRRSPGLFGAIMDPAAQAFDDMRAALPSGGADAA